VKRPGGVYVVKLRNSHYATGERDHVGCNEWTTRQRFARRFGSPAHAWAWVFAGHYSGIKTVLKYRVVRLKGRPRCRCCE
jgi:fructose-1,6-bisphosphatase/inositol monophosphatase family enzyme